MAMKIALLFYPCLYAPGSWCFDIAGAEPTLPGLENQTSAEYLMGWICNGLSEWGVDCGGRYPLMLTFDM